MFFKVKASKISARNNQHIVQKRKIEDTYKAKTYQNKSELNRQIFDSRDNNKST